MKNAIFFGNGLNRLNGGFSWENLLKEITKDSLIDGISNTLQYEAIILALDYYDYKPFITADGYQFVSADGLELRTKDKPAEENIKNKIKDALEKFETNQIYKRLAELDIEHYITTNYDQTLYKQLIELGFKEGASNNSEKLYSIRRKFQMKKNADECKVIWPMHGTIKSPKSIMLGLDHYCGSVGKINEYLKGNYKYSQSQRLESLIHRLRNKDCETPLSWIDLFFTHNIHILGFGLMPDEIDIWWILNRRQRYIRQHGSEGIITNKIYYYGDVEENTSKLLRRLGIEVRVFPEKDSHTSYEEQYEYFIDEIESLSTDKN